MSDFLLGKICSYLEQGKIKVEFNITQCIEKDIYSLKVYNNEGELLEKFNIRKGDMEVIKFVVKVENLQDVII